MRCSIPVTVRCSLRLHLKTALGSLPVLLLLLPVLLLSTGCRQAHSLTAHPPPAPARTNGASAHTEIGFATRQKFLDHYDKHGAEFGSISKEEYLHQAQELRDRPAGGNVLEVTRADGVVTRFDKQTGAFLAFNADLTIRTFFKPNDGENYFRRQSKRSAGKSEREGER